MPGGVTAASVPLSYFVTLSIALFGLGLYGALRRTNAITILMCIELMLNAVNINLVAFSRHIETADPVRGQVFAIFVMCLAAAEVSVGLAIILSIVRVRKTIDVNEMNVLKG